MKAEATYPIDSLHGNISPDHYARELNGQLIIQRRPKRTKPATEAQKEREKRLLKNMRSAK